LPVIRQILIILSGSKEWSGDCGILLPRYLVYLTENKKASPVQVRLYTSANNLNGPSAGYYSDQNSNNCQYQKYVDKVTNCFAKSYIANQPKNDQYNGYYIQNASHDL
jgi:hypothetical protein